MRISCIQMDMELGQVEHNFALAEKLIRDTVATEKSDVVVLPETWNTGFSPGDISPEMADVEGKCTKALFSSLAKELNVNIVGGSVTTIKGGKLFNTAYIFARNGELVGEYNKTHQFSPMGEDKYYEKGSSVCSFTLDGFRCGIIICYDLRFPELTRTLTLKGLDMLFVVSQWPLIRKTHLVTLARARAIENQMFLALCNSAGKAGATQYGGHSAIFDPWGEYLAEAKEGTCVITGEADMKVLDGIRSSIPVFNDRRSEIYEII